MKYEYLCGYESDFLAMPENIIAVVQLDHCVQGLTEFNQITECGKPVLAMRRIIAEPKRWTVADQKAGRLPENNSGLYLCSGHEGTKFVCYRRHNEWIRSPQMKRVVGITHWMPIPKFTEDENVI